MGYSKTYRKVAVIKAQKLNFLEVVGALTLVIFIILMMYWIGWIIMLFFAWCCSTWAIFYLTYHFMLEGKYLIQSYILLFPLMISAFLFWFGLSGFSDVILHALNETLIWYSLIVLGSSAVLTRLFLKKKQH